MPQALLELHGMTKRFPGVLANDAVSLSVNPQEIHALLGENGAGKSTLVKMIYGVMRPDHGCMRLDGEAYAPHKPAEARAKGIGMVFQQFSLFEGLTVAENIALGIRAKMARSGLRQRIAAVSSAYGLRLDPDRRVGNLSVGERQRIEIVRCLLQEPKLIIMDEPTSVLAPQEIEVLFQTLRRLRSEGCSILYISHKLEEIRALCDRATILRDGKVVGNCDPKQQSTQQLAEMMIGTPLMPPQRATSGLGPVRLKVVDLTLASEEQFGVDLEHVDLEVRGGEIFGIAGVAGNGQAELMAALIGERLANRPGAIAIDGTPVGAQGPSVRRALGLTCVPEERMGYGSVADLALWENALLTASTRMKLATWGFIGVPRAKRFAGKIVREFAVRTRGIEHAVRGLSDGNLQKFVMGREMLQAPGVLIAAQPTWGVDAGAAATIHTFLLSLAKLGTAVLIVSQDLDELFAISSRIAVFAGGRLSPARPVDELTTQHIGLAMGTPGGWDTPSEAPPAHA
ncbi:MAG TPA: ABC transporter ATP-binding protein [Hyphomicrobiaceae bacterium]|jgi:simple sugar transport system ATP-binding protein